MDNNEFIEKAKNLYWDGMNRYIQILEGELGDLPDSIRENVSDAIDNAQKWFEKEMGWNNE